MTCVGIGFLVSFDEIGATSTERAWQGCGQPVVHVGVPQRERRACANHPVRVPPGAKWRVCGEMPGRFPWVCAYRRVHWIQPAGQGDPVRLLGACAAQVRGGHPEHRRGG